MKKNNEHLCTNDIIIIIIIIILIVLQKTQNKTIRNVCIGSK